jgi:hypothetical protein
MKTKIFLMLRCDTRFQRAFTACCCVFKEITLVWVNQRNYLENATTCSELTLKMRVATQLYALMKENSIQQVFVEPSRQFHHHFTRVFFVRKFFAQLFSSYVLVKKRLSYKKHASKMLMKLTLD